LGKRSPETRLRSSCRAIGWSRLAAGSAVSRRMAASQQNPGSSRSKAVYKACLGFSIALVLLPIPRQGVNLRWLKDEERRGKTAWPDKLQPMPLPVIGAPTAPACQANISWEA
jgi:hypothetical protein